MSFLNGSRRAVAHAIAALAMVVLAGCGGNGNNAPQPGRAEIKVMLPRELAAEGVARVHVAVRGPGIPTPIGTELTLQGGTWQGTLADIPAGLDRVFEAQAFDAASTLLYQGQAGPTTVAAGSTVNILILLQQVNPPPQYNNVAPTIDSVVVSSNQVSPGGTITLTATAHDDNPEDTITYAWTSSAGSFSASTAAVTNWVAPTTEGVQVLRLEVTDSKGTSATLTVDISVQRSGSTGNATVTVGFNTWPRITAMMAAPSVLVPNRDSQIAAVVFDPDADTLSFSWTSNCQGVFGRSNTATPSFAVLAQPASGNRCNLTVTVTDGRGGQTTGTLSLLVGSDPSANVAPQVDSTFKSSEQVGGSEVATVGLTAHDPESTPLTFTWSANQGVILTTRSTSTSSEIDWRAPACIDGTVVLTAVITDGGGATTRQQFSIAPRGGAACGGLAVTGTRLSHRVQADGSVFMVPADLSAVSIGAWVPTADGLSYSWRPGSGQSNGSFTIPNVESTPYLLKFGNAYLWATSRSLDLSRAELGRPDVESEPTGTQLAVQISGLAPWQDTDDLEFHSPSTGIGYFSAWDCAAPVFEAPQMGDTSFVGSMDYVTSMRNCGSPPARIDPNRGDVFYASQMVSRTDPVGMQIRELRRSFQTNTLNGATSEDGSLLLSGTLEPLPTTTQPVDYRASSFEALSMAAHPTATAYDTLLYIGTLPGHGQYGEYAGWPDLAGARSVAGQGDLVPMFTYGNPYPATWPRFVTAQTSSRVSYSVEREDGSTTTPRAFSVFTFAQEPLSSQPVIPRVGPPRELRINGVVATGNLANVGLAPLVSWTPPSLGVPTSYSLRLYELVITSSGGTNRLQLTNLTTTQTQLRLPPGLVVQGKSYYLQVTAIFDPVSDPNKPYMSGPVHHTAMAVTGRFKP
ncbi:PKD domain-containing protein [Hyalangium gracile]|uniref:PKD domain-containing protein n=1 Tax=Hyalangium gracile TaxID=394092 RepID=UPI0021E122D8|nr:hypothetical protein [Hyalangium gracile]